MRVQFPSIPKCRSVKTTLNPRCRHHSLRRRRSPRLCYLLRFRRMTRQFD
jgi:hypothetical protein